ncbi:Proteasome subunit beta type-7-A [Entophlyctis sp. JEL0112]|nr:Proteasome subunit beta type-7-A [Entophlyctis sp. JEL0112]
MARHHPDLIFCRKQPGIAIGRLCEKHDAILRKATIAERISYKLFTGATDSQVRPAEMVRICDECNYGTFQGRCVICGNAGISDAFYCKECVILEKDRDGCPKIVNLGSAKTDLFYERKKRKFLEEAEFVVVNINKKYLNTRKKIHKIEYMAAAGLATAAPKGGFSFDLCARNDMLASKGVKLPKATKTGTTIVGCLYKDGLVLGADTRATSGPIVADKNCEKIHYLAPNMYCCGAGTAADTEFTTNLISSKLELHTLATGREARVATAMTIYQGHIGAALVLGGVDVTGPHLYTIYPHGSTDKLPFVTMGSGSLAAMSVFESRWKAELTREEAVELVKDAIEAGIFNDLGSGSNVDVCVITKGNVEYLRNYRKPNERVPKLQSYKYKRGTTATLTSDFRKFVDVIEGDAMDVS